MAPEGRSIDGFRAWGMALLRWRLRANLKKHGASVGNVHGRGNGMVGLISVGQVELAVGGSRLLRVGRSGRMPRGMEGVGFSIKRGRLLVLAGPLALGPKSLTEQRRWTAIPPFYWAPTGMFFFLIALPPLLKLQRSEWMGPASVRGCARCSIGWEGVLCGRERIHEEKEVRALPKPAEETWGRR